MYVTHTTQLVSGRGTIMKQITTGEDVMTDFQFKAILALVSSMLENCETAEEFKQAKQKIIDLSLGKINQAEAVTAKRPKTSGSKK